MVDSIWIRISLLRCSPETQRYRDAREKQKKFSHPHLCVANFIGTRKSSRIEENVARIDQLAQRSSILPCDTQTAKIYGDIKAELRAKGRPIPENDIWIASIVRQYGLILVTRDVHFGEIDGLQVERW